MGTDTLFEQHTVKEIQEIEKKLRNDIERKKEELRQMVGERYRDLMEAADTITEMKDIAESVTSRIKAMEEHCTNLKHSSIQSGILHAVKAKVAERKKKNEMLYAIAAQIKILMDTPAKITLVQLYLLKCLNCKKFAKDYVIYVMKYAVEEKSKVIWSAIECEDHLKAMLLYLLAQHTHSLLLLDPIYQEQLIFQHFPVINRQWTSINHFRHILLQNCQDVLQAQDIDAEKVTGPLCCIALLSDSSPEQVFQEVLLTRKTAVQNIFKPEKYGKIAKTQVCELVALIQNTLKIVHAVFYPVSESTEGDKTNLFLNTLVRVTSKDLPGPVSLLDLQSSSSFRFLPKVITEFRPTPKVKAEPISVEFLQKTCEQWVQQIKADMVKGLHELLNYVNTVKGLALIREAVMEHLSQVTHWDLICNRLLKQPFCIWDVFLRPAFVERIKAIITSQVESSSYICIKDTEETLKELIVFKESSSVQLEKNIMQYIWTESSSDLTPNLGWIPHHQRHLWDGGTLGMKACGFTPRVQNMCKTIDMKLQDLLEDLAFFTKQCRNSEDQFKDKGNLFGFMITAPKDVDLSPDTPGINKHLRDVTEQCCSKIIQHFQITLNSLSNADKRPNIGAATRFVFLGHLCHGLTELCPHLKQCIMSVQTYETTEPLTKRSFSVTGHFNMIKDDPLWQSVKSKLLEISDSAFRIWSKSKVETIIQEFKVNFQECSATRVLKSLLQWDKVEIQEESEEGNAVKSVVHIPQQVSTPLYFALFNLCCEVNRIGGHALSRQVRFEIREDLLNQFLTIYESNVSAQWPEEQYSLRLLQTKSLQVLFDIQFLMGLIGPRENSEHQLCILSREIVSKVELQIDPFDFDVFSPLLQVNLRKALQKCSLLLGLVASPEQIGHLNSLKAQSMSGQMDHNIMLVTNINSRFPLLPLACRTGHSTLTPSVTESVDSSDGTVKGSPLKASRTHSSSPNLSASASPASVLKSASFYDRFTAMGSSWFGGT